MEDSYYLAEGHILGGHYEIVKVLGEDEFEILYLVKDIHRLDSLFVIKELFLKAYARRENESVQVMAKSKLLFEDTKKEMIDEIIMAQKKGQSSDVQTYGYLEENNTIYTIMEFINDSNLSHYLQNNLVNKSVNHESVKEERRDEIILPPIVLPSKKSNNKKDTQSTQEIVEIEEPILKEEKKPKKSYIFLKILSVAVLIMAGLAYYSWDMIQKDKQRAKEHKVSVVTKKTPHASALHNRDEESKESVKKEKEPIKEEEPKVEDKKESINEEPKAEETKEQPSDDSYIEEEQEFEVVDDAFDIPNEEVNLEEEVETVAPVKQENSNILGKRIGGEKKRTVGFNRMSVKRFLDKFLASSRTGSIDDIVSLYDSKVDRYFSLKNVNHRTIRKDKINYQKRWTKRDFRLVAFKIRSIYRKGNSDYCDLSTTVQWNVSSDNSKRSAGRSKGRMTLKRTSNGFKVTSVYTVK